MQHASAHASHRAAVSERDRRRKVAVVDRVMGACMLCLRAALGMVAGGEVWGAMGILGCSWRLGIGAGVWMGVVGVVFRGLARTFKKSGLKWVV